MLVLDKKMEEIYQELDQYWKMVEEMELPNPEILDLTKAEALCIVQEIHSTRKKTSVEMTRTLFQLLYDHKVITAQQLYDNYGWNNRPVLHRFHVLRKYHLVRRVSKKYYVATPRLRKFVENYMDELLSLF